MVEKASQLSLKTEEAKLTQKNKLKSKSKSRLKIMVLSRVALTLFSLLILLSSSLQAINFQAGAFYGSRQVADRQIKEVYGNGLVYFPFAEIIYKGFILGGGFEGGYSKDGTIGLFKEPTSLKMSGYEVYIGYQFKSKVAPYLKVGYGSYAYKQTIQSAYLAEFKVDHKKGAPLVAFGLKIYPVRNIFLAGEVKYVPLQVNPLEEKVDLSGLRFLAGLGVAF